jgi:hypothetical protein
VQPLGADVVIIGSGMRTHELLLGRAKRLLRASGHNAILTQRFDISMNSHQCGIVVAETEPLTSVLDPCAGHAISRISG